MFVTQRDPNARNNARNVASIEVVCFYTVKEQLNQYLTDWFSQPQKSPDKPGFWFGTINAQEVISSTVRPRRWATRSGDCMASRPLIVARTTLIFIVEP